ncbi:MAG TPA: alpha,alpha-trehalase TreF [Nevskiaceae bacterium]|nr:alpha,alpha-trehalase TreF [Nevskiaceae bacterium]
MRPIMLAAGWLAAGCVLAQPVPSPSQQYGALYAQVETQSVFADSKTFADAVPRAAPAAILRDYRAQHPATREQLRAFVRAHFILPDDGATAPATAGAPQPLAQHIADLWPQLIRPPVAAAPGSSQLAFPYPHAVPGGRFREIYYWDSYFTMLGLQRDGHGDVAQAMVNGFAGLIARYGHVPNGTRSYYLTRSQPPFFHRMVGLMTPQQPALAYQHYLAALRREHAWWMDGERGLRAGAAQRHVVRMADGALLNRYWDAGDTPRDESYREDIETARASGRPAAEVYRELRSAAESGWDFSSRWFADGKSLATIETTRIVPVDLNALLYGLERAIEQGCAQARDLGCVHDYGARADARRVAMNQYLWDGGCGCYEDFQWRRGQRIERVTAATLYPLFTGAADDAQAHAVAATARAQLLMPGGLATTRTATGQQWDAPNGWAPLQWIAIAGLRAYGEDGLAGDIATRWLATVQAGYDGSGKLVEKYDVEQRRPGGGGEYPLQDGFGWTNGVTRALLGP